MKSEKEVLMYDSDEIAIYRTDIKGWVGKNGRYYGNNENSEHLARWDNCTHTKCECGEIIPHKSYLKCNKCRDEASQIKYKALPYKEYDGSPVVEYYGDTYFFSEEDIIEYLTEHELVSIDLVFCDENNYYQIDSDYWSDIMPINGEGELPDKLREALDNLNKVIAELPPCSYSPGKVRTTYILDESDKEKPENF